MTPLPKRLFVAAGDTSGSDDLYIYTSTTNPIRWRQVFYYPGAAVGCATEDFSAKMFSFNNVAIMLTFDAATPNEQFISFDRGSSWARFVLGTIPFCYGGNNERAIYLCTFANVYASYNKCLTWINLGVFRSAPPVLTGVPIHIFSFSGATLPAFAVFTDEGRMYRSTNNGATWTQIATGLTAIVKVLQFGDYLIAFGNTKSCFSLNQGATWSVPIDYYAGIIFGVDYLDDADQSDFESSTIVASVSGKVCVSQDFATSWVPFTAFPGGYLHSIIHAYAHVLLSVNRSGYYFMHRGLAETTDQILFDVGNTNIKPASIMKISPQTTAAFLSSIIKNAFKKSIIAPSLSLFSFISLTLSWHWFTCGTSHCGECLGGFLLNGHPIKSKITEEIQ